MSAGLQSLDGWKTSGSRLFLIDKSEPFHINPDSGYKEPARCIHEKCESSVEAVVENFGEWKNVEIVKERIPEKLVNVGIEKEAFLHIDLSHRTAECEAPRYFWPKIVSGGIVLLDDYGTNTKQNNGDEFRAR